MIYTPIFKAFPVAGAALVKLVQVTDISLRSKQNERLSVGHYRFFCFFATGKLMYLSVFALLRLSAILAE